MRWNSTILMAFMRGLLTVAVVFVAGCTSDAELSDPFDLAIRNVTIVNIETGDVQEKQTIAIRGRRIAHIGATRSRIDIRAVEEHDGNGAYLIPGLWDMHVHLRANTPEGEVTLEPARWHIPLALSYGVTGLRDLASNMDDILALREDMKARRLRGEAAPNMSVAGTLFSGPQPWGFVKHGTYPETEEEARAQVRNHIARGVDFIKIHDFLAPDIYRAIVAEAVAQDQWIVGHLRSDYGPLASIRLGQRDFEHIPPELLSFCRAGGKDRVRTFYNNWFKGGPDYFHRQMVGLYDAEGCKALFAQLGTEGVTITPTLTLRKPVSEARFERAQAVLPTGHFALCEAGRESEQQTDPDVYKRYDAMMGAVVRTLADSQVTLLAGTDRPTYGCGVPGWDLVEELRTLVKAGLSHQEALSAATHLAAQKAGFADSGRIAVGAEADLILLTENPLKGFDDLDKPTAVISAGAYLSASDLQTLRKEAANYAHSLSE